MATMVPVIAVSGWDAVKPKDADTKKFDLVLSALGNAYRAIEKDPSADRYKALSKLTDDLRKEGAAVLKVLDKKKHAKAVSWAETAVSDAKRVATAVDGKLGELSDSASKTNAKALAKPELSADWMESCGFGSPAAKGVAARLRVFENADRGAQNNLAEWGPKARKALEDLKADVAKLQGEVKGVKGEHTKAELDALAKLLQLAAKKAEDYPPS